MPRLEPADAERLVRQGVRFAIQWCGMAPVLGRTERFARDVGAYMVLRTAAEAYVGARTVPTVLVGELGTAMATGTFSYSWSRVLPAVAIRSSRTTGKPDGLRQ